MSQDERDRGRGTVSGVPEFRVRVATGADVPALTDLHYQVFNVESHLAMALGRHFIRSVYRWYVRGPSAFALLAESNGVAIGSCTFCLGGYRRVFVENWAAIVRGAALNPLQVVRYAPWGRLLRLPLGRRRQRRGDNHLSKRAYIGLLAVDRAFRGASGIGPALVSAGLGWEIVSTSVHRDNLAARFMYRVLGFRECAVDDGAARVVVEIDLGVTTRAVNH
jgi:ribosomal protein S18 acetylase RimI-like enzyme